MQGRRRQDVLVGQLQQTLTQGEQMADEVSAIDGRNIARLKRFQRAACRTS